MYPWETLYIYCQQDPRWFEPLSRYAPDDAHLSVFRELMPSQWRLRRRGLWFIADPPQRRLLDQGWKLHVSTRPGESVDLLRAAIPPLRDSGVQFKFLLDRRAVALTGGKLWPRGSSGKFITIYPDDDAAFRQIAADLTIALRGFEGPYILSDRRVPDSSTVFYRYGGFTGVPQIRPDGTVNLMIAAPDGTLVPDIRTPYWTTPEWVSTDPFGEPVEDTDDDSGDDLLGGRFEVIEAIQFSNRGGVYRATDTQTGDEVVIKEARPHIGVGDVNSTQDYTAVLAKEHRLLTELADDGSFVRPIALFQEWEHTFLVEEMVSGPQLSQLSISDNPIYTLMLDPQSMASYYDRIRRLFGEFVSAVATAHARGIVLGDLSWTNVLVNETTDKLVIIDLESAIRSGIDEPLGMHTKGVSSPRFIETGKPTEADDFYSVGAMLFGSIMLLNTFLGYRPDALPRFLDSLHTDLGLPEDLVALVTDLTADPGGAPPDADTLVKRLADLSVGEASAWPEVIPLAEPASRQIVGERAERLHCAVADTVVRVVDYLHATADPHRDDRLFPADVGVFETNPLNIAHGAAGVLHALSRLPGKVPGKFVSWLLEHPIDGAKQPPGLYYGQSGVAWVLADLGHTGYAARVLRQAGDHRLLQDQHDILRGAAGHGMACLRLWQATGDDDFLDRATAIGARLRQTGVTTGRGTHWSVTDHEGAEHVPLGYGNGPAGVALFQLYLHLATGDAEALALGRSALDFELSHAVELNANLTAFRGDADPERDPVLRGYWEKGTAGVLTTLTRYVAATGDTTLEAWVDRLLPDICRKYAVMPQMFHGLAGVGNTLIDVAELTGRPEALDEAWRTAEGVLLFRIDAPEGTVFPSEQALRESGDFATGSAGVGLFLNRLLISGGDRATNFNFVLDDLLPQNGNRR